MSPCILIIYLTSEIVNINARAIEQGFPIRIISAAVLSAIDRMNML